MARISRSKGSDREAKVLKVRRGIRAAQLRVVLDEKSGRTTPDAVVRLSKLDMPKISEIAKTTPRVDQQHHMTAAG
jgi:hypothetical protein